MNSNKQRGGTLGGFILGLVIGLGVALGVAIYVTKVPTPFTNKNQPRSAEQESTETQKNKDWNPNSVLQPKAPAEVPTSPAPSSAPSSSSPSAAPVAADTAPRTSQDKTSDKTAEKTADKAHSDVRAPAVSADPLVELAKSKSGLTSPAGSSAANDPFDYLIQVGAYRNMPDADAQKARLALMGLDAKVSEREQAGRTVFRVRLGPFTDKAAAERVRAKLESSGIDNTLVRVQR